MESQQLYIALGFLMACAVSTVTIAAFRLRENVRRKRVDAAIETGDALAMPLTGSVLLFSLYVLFRFIPKSYINVLLSFYLSLISIFALGSFIKPLVRPRVVTGLFCVATAAFYFATNNWVANDVLAFAIAVTAMEAAPISDFTTSFLLLIGLFFYDIFWVFGSDVMLSVATGVDGPIKLVFPQTIFGDHEKKSLLGLGDLIIPGFFITQTLIFSRDHVKRGGLYFYVAIVAYFLSLLNTMIVMVVFKHGQPALLFIVPWLLITFTAVAVVKGDVKAALEFDTMTTFSSTEGTPEGGSAAAKPDSEESIGEMIWESVKELFGFKLDSDAKTATLGEKEKVD